jgi:hypothetical protein
MVDLTTVDLITVDLAMVDLSMADLTMVDLSMVDFSMDIQWRRRFERSDPGGLRDNPSKGGSNEDK